MNPTKRLTKKPKKNKKQATLSKVNHWIGGVQFYQNDWHHPENWNQKEVPNEMHHVIIHPTNSLNFNYPIISHEVPEIGILEIAAGAKLFIEKQGSLSVLGAKKVKSSIRNDGQVVNKGQLKVIKSKQEWLEMIDGYFMNEGQITISKIKRGPLVNNKSVFINKGKIGVI